MSNILAGLHYESEENYHWTPYKGVTILQKEGIYNVLKDFFEKVQPSQVLEIGTSHGGLTLLVRDLLNDVGLSESKIISYDIMNIRGTEVDKEISNGLEIELRIKNVFDNTYSKLELEEEIKEIIQSSGTTIVLCDGGNKSNEFNILAPYLKKGDIIMAHDYAPTEEYYLENIHHKIWCWHEIQDSNIAETVEKYNLKPFMQDIFQSVVWVCKIKE